jgi:hypothetical protein
MTMWVREQHLTVVYSALVEEPLMSYRSSQWMEVVSQCLLSIPKQRSTLYGHRKRVEAYPADIKGYLLICEV